MVFKFPCWIRSFSSPCDANGFSIGVLGYEQASTKHLAENDSNTSLERRAPDAMCIRYSGVANASWVVPVIQPEESGNRGHHFAAEVNRREPNLPAPESPRLTLMVIPPQTS